tara:strand:- start:340 stop:1722 length:1383 start_codon:yes stop_codon:yes gene_type:complete
MSLIIPANSLAGGFAIDNSLRFNSASSDYLSRTPASASNRKTWTWSAWYKGSGTQWSPFGGGGGSNDLRIIIDADGRIRTNVSGVGNYNYSNGLYRDVSAWYHLVWKFDTTEATASDRSILYINGEAISDQNIANFSLNTDYAINTNTLHAISRLTNSAVYYHDGYMSEINFIDGQALTPTDFGEFDEDSGAWKPIAFSGSYGTNGFFLEFQDSGALGTDSSGNANTFTVNNLTSIDQTTDTPTNNFATLNALANYYFSGTFSEGNLKVASNSAVESYITNTMGVSTGKWYWEIKITSSGSGRDFVGIADTLATASIPFPSNSKVISYYGFDGQSVNGSTGNGAYGDTFGTGDIIGVAMDLDNYKLYFSKNGTFQNSGVPTSGATGTGALAIDSSPADGVYYSQFANIHNTASTFEANYGNPSFTITTGNADANGYGNFEYAVPTGYLSLCTKNLSEVNS